MWYTRKITGIMACDPSGVIGNAGRLPWNYPDELSHFQATVFGQVVIMGRKTFDSIPDLSLANYIPIVFSKNEQFAASIKNVLSMRHVKIFSSLEEIELLNNLSSNLKIFMIGGAEIAHLFLKKGLITEFILTKIHKPYQGDTLLDLTLLQDWNEALIKQTENYTTYRLTPNFISQEKGNS